MVSMSCWVQEKFDRTLGGIETVGRIMEGYFVRLILVFACSSFVNVITFKLVRIYDPCENNKATGLSNYTFKVFF